MARKARCPETVEATRKTIARLLPQGYPTVQLTARVLGMIVRMLQRRLAAAGTSHSQIVDEVRFEAACRLLGYPGRSIADIASALSYSDPAHFTRAFVRWTGTTPRAYRQQSIQRYDVKRRPR